MLDRNVKGRATGRRAALSRHARITTVSDSLVFASRRPPFPTETGARIRTHRLLTGLSQAFSTTFVTFEHHERSPDGHCSREEVAAALPGIHVVTVPGLGPYKRPGQVLSLPSRHSWMAGRYRCRAMSAALGDAVRRTASAVVHFDDLGVGQLSPVPGPLNVYAPADIEHRIAQQTIGAVAGGRRAFAQVERRKLEREEVRVMRQVGLCLAVSDIDATAMRAAGADRIELCPNGTDPVARLAPPYQVAGDAFRVLFVGSGDYGPYERGLAWFVRNVLPLLRQPAGVTVDVVGRPPRRPVLAPGVNYVGRVRSVAPWYEQAHAVVVPVFEGSGTRLKVIEAMAYGRPVVSTSLGAEGLPVTPGTHYHQADDAAGFAHALASVAEATGVGDDRLDRMLDEARAAVTPLFWPNIVAGLVTLYETEMAARRG